MKSSVLLSKFIIWFGKMWDSDNFHVSTTQNMQQQCPHDPPSYFRLSKSNVFRFRRNLVVMMVSTCMHIFALALTPTDNHFLIYDDYWVSSQIYEARAEGLIKKNSPGRCRRSHSISEDASLAAQESCRRASVWVGDILLPPTRNQKNNLHSRL